MVYHSDASTEDCCLCGGHKPAPSYWGQDNAVLTGLDTFEIPLIEINRYDRLDRRLIEDYTGVVPFGGGSTDGGFSANLMLDYDKGFPRFCGNLKR